MIAVSAGCPHCGRRFDEVSRSGFFKAIRMIWLFFSELNAHKTACRQAMIYSHLTGSRIVQ